MRRLLIAGLIVGLLTGCSLDDERDTCNCGLTLHFRYMVSGEDVFSKPISSLRHFLFNGEGDFMREVEHVDVDKQDLYIDEIEDGSYKLVTLANTTEANSALNLPKEWMTRSEGLNLQDFRLSLNNIKQDGTYDNADEIFYNEVDFQKAENAKEYYDCDLSNVHCHLRVFLFWNKLPDYTGTFTMRLRDVPADFALSPDSTMRILGPLDEESLDPTATNAVQRFPVKMGRLVEHTIEVKPYNFTLDGEFITHRWTNEQMPVLQVFNQGQPVTKEIDMARVLQAWQISPDSDAVQEYAIQIEVYPDGTSKVTKLATGRVNDWINGGTVWG